jgi:phage terminase large subunit GpA-like protein
VSVWGRAFMRHCKPRSKMTGSQWADTRRYVAPGTSPEPGEWRTSRVPYLREPQDCVTDRATEMVVMMCSSQIGKSEFLLNVAGYYADQEPSPQLMLMPTVEACEAFSKERLEPTFQYSPGLRGKLEDGKDGRGTAKKSSTTIRMKHYPGGYIALVGANSPAGLASRPIRIGLFDEVDRYGTTKEGDPIKLAMQRTTNFHNRKLCLVSTPTTKASSKIYEYWLKSDQRYYHVPCPHCGEFQKLAWGQVRWDKDGAGVAMPETARYHCAACDRVLRGAGKPPQAMLEAGVWMKTCPDSKIAGFHINSMYSPWVELSALVAEFVEATKSRDRKGLMEFINLKLGEPWEDVANDYDYELLHRTRRQYYDGEVPEGALLLTVGCDTQDHYLAAECVGWGVGKQSWGIEYRIFMGNTKEPEVWAQFDEWRQRVRERADGVQMRVVATFVDSGGHSTDEVYKFCAQRENQRVYAIKGRGGEVPMIGKPTRNNRHGAPRIDLGVDALKSDTLHAVMLQDEGPKYCHFNRDPAAGYDVDYFKGLLSERLEYKFDKEKGKSVVRWVKVHERNEPLDVRNYNTAAMEMLNPDFDALAARLSAGPAAAPAPRKRRTGVLSRGV